MDKEKKTKGNVPNDFHSTSPVYNSTFKQDPLHHYTLKEKLAMDLDYYLPSYILEEEESTPSLVNNFVPSPVEDQEKNGDGTNENKQKKEDKELKDIQDNDKNTTEEDSDWEIEREDNYLDYLDSNYIY